MNGHELEKLCREVRRWFIARGAPPDYGDDIQSAAALAVMTAYRKKRLPLEGNRGYYFAVAVRGHGGAGEVVRALSSPVRLGGREERRAATRPEAPRSFPINGVRPVLGKRGWARQAGHGGGVVDVIEQAASVAVPPPTPEETLEAGARARAAERVVRRVLGHAQALPPEARRNVAHLLRDVAPGVRVPRRKPTRNAAWNTVARLGRIVRANPAAVRDRAAMLGVEAA